jgi:hypothetical protein
MQSSSCLVGMFYDALNELFFRRGDGETGDGQTQRGFLDKSMLTMNPPLRLSVEIALVLF